MLIIVRLHGVGVNFGTTVSDKLLEAPEIDNNLNLVKRSTITA